MRRYLYISHFGGNEKRGAIALTIAYFRKESGYVCERDVFKYRLYRRGTDIWLMGHTKHMRNCIKIMFSKYFISSDVIEQKITL